MEWQGVEEMRRRLRRLTKPVQRMRMKVRATGLKAAKAGAKPHPENLGSLANTIKGVVLGGRGVAFDAKFSTSNPVAVQLHEGRPAGKPPTIKATQRWRRRRGIQTGPRTLQRQMRERGTKPVPYMEQAIAAVEEKLPGYISEAEQAMVAEWDRVA